MNDDEMMRMENKMPWNQDQPGRVLVFEAHSDDAAIGMGGLIKLFTSQGVPVTICTVTRGETASGTRGEEETARLRVEEGKQADAILGVRDHVFWETSCQAVVNDKPTFHAFVSLIRQLEPAWIFTHGSHEWHRDHRAIASLTDEAWWKAGEANVLPGLGAPYKAMAVYHYEVLPVFPWTPDICIDVSSYWEVKRKALACFASQAATMHDFDGLVEGKGLYRGFLIGARHAEAFTSSRFMPRATF